MWQSDLTLPFATTTTSRCVYYNCKKAGALWTGPRSKERRNKRATSWIWTEILVAHFSFLELGSPKGDYQSLMGLCRSSPNSMFLVYRLYRSIVGFSKVKLHEVSPSRGLERIISMIGNVEDDLVGNSHMIVCNNKHIKEAATVAQPVLPWRLSLPEKAGLVEPEKWLTPSQRFEFEDPLRRIHSPGGYLPEAVLSC